MKKLQGILMLLLSSVLLVSCQANKNENKEQNKEQTTQNESNKQEDSVMLKFLRNGYISKI